MQRFKVLLVCAAFLLSDSAFAFDSSLEDFDVPIINYAQVRDQIFKVSCVQCHNSMIRRGNVMLTSYANVSRNMNRIIREIDNGIMPVADKHLSTEQLSLFSLWVCQGYTKEGRAGNCPPSQ